MWGLGGERPERALKCMNTIITLRDTVAWSIDVSGRANVLINIFTVFRASSQGCRRSDHDLGGLEITPI
jgi:hypothetical protein